MRQCMAVVLTYSAFFQLEAENKSKGPCQSGMRLIKINRLCSRRKKTVICASCCRASEPGTKRLELCWSSQASCYCFCLLLWPSLRPSRPALSSPVQFSSRREKTRICLPFSRICSWGSADEEVRPNYTAPLGIVPPASRQKEGGFLSADSQDDC